jgi:uncharacterized protein YqhQ
MLERLTEMYSAYTVLYRLQYTRPFLEENEEEKKQQQQNKKKKKKMMMMLMMKMIIKLFSTYFGKYSLHQSVSGY